MEATDVGRHASMLYSLGQALFVVAAVFGLALVWSSNYARCSSAACGLLIFQILSSIKVSKVTPWRYMDLEAIIYLF